MDQLKITGSYTLLCIACLTIMVGALVAPGLISISEGLGVNNNAILLVTLPALGAVVFAPIAGKLIDKYGAYQLLVIGLFLYGFLGASVYWLYGPAAVFTNRIMLGGVTSVVMASSTVLISQWYFGKARLDMIAKQGMAIELGGVIILFLGGLLAVQYWALPLILYLAALVFLVMLLLFVPRNHPPEIKMKTSSERIMLNKGLSLKSVYFIATLSMVSFFSAFVLIPSTMHAQNYGEDDVGLLLAFISLVAVAAAHFMPRLIEKYGEQKVLACAFMSYSASYVFFTQVGTPTLIIGAIFSGIGFGFSIPLLNHMTVERSDAKVRGRNLSYFTMAVFSGQFLTSLIDYIPSANTTIFIGYMIFCIIIAAILFIKSIGVYLEKTLKESS